MTSAGAGFEPLRLGRTTVIDGSPGADQRGTSREVFTAGAPPEDGWERALTMMESPGGGSGAMGKTASQPAAQTSITFAANNLQPASIMVHGGCAFPRRRKRRRWDLQT